MFTRYNNNGAGGSIRNSLRIAYYYTIGSPRYMIRNFHSKAPVYYSESKFKPKQENKKISVNDEGLEIETPLGVTKPWTAHPKLLVETVELPNGYAYTMSITHKLPPYSKLPSDVKVVFCQQLSDDFQGKHQFLFITDKPLPIKFIVNGGG